MAHHCIKYRLNADGTIPSFICFHENGVHGVFPFIDSTPSPRDMLMIGISENDDLGDATEITTQADLQDYLASIGSDWIHQDPSDPSGHAPFDAVAAAAWVWGKLTALNGG